MPFRVHEGVLLSFGFPNLLKGNTLASQFPQDSLHHLIAALPLPDG
jgi:hypothetical protein